MKSGKRIIASLAFAALVAAALPLASASATFPGENGAIVWSSSEPRTGPDSPALADIFMKSVGDSTAINLTDTPNSEDNYPQVSPDGETLAFGSDRNSPGDLDPFLLDLDTLAVTTLPSTADSEGWFAWSPDGTKLAWSAQNRSTFASTIKVLTVNGGNVASLTGGWHPNFSQDGSKIVFVQANGAPNDLYSINASGGTPTQLTNTPNDYEFAPNYSPDGTKILYSRSNADFSDVNLWTMSSTGTNQQQLTTLAGWESEPSWSPDGTQIVYTRDPDGFAGPASQDLVLAPLSSPNNPTNFYVSELIEDHPDWQALGNDPGPTPTPTPTETAGPAEVKPSLTIKLAKHLVITAGVIDEDNNCRSGIPFKIQRYVAGKWKTIASGLGSDTGTLSKKVADKPGKYRISSSAFTDQKGNTCLASKSAAKTHTH